MRVEQLFVVLLITAGMVTSGTWALPQISDVQMAQRENSRIVDISYTLSGEPAIVTLGIETNDIALQDAVVTRLSGDVCKVVQPGTGKRIEWNAGADWPEHFVTNAEACLTAWCTNTPPAVMLIDLSKGVSATAEDPYPVYYYTSVDALPYGGLTNEIYKTLYLVLRKLSAGIFSMGDESLSGENVAVQLTKDFYAGVFEVTQKQWFKVMGTTPSQTENETGPVESISYCQVREDADANAEIDPHWPQTNEVGASSFIGKLRVKTSINGFDLPTEAQWEYLCRAGTSSYYNDGIAANSTNQMNVLGWYSSNSDAGTHTVGLKNPNAWGLYDTLGNVWEWCLDYPVETLAADIDPVGAASNAQNQRVRRGGSYLASASICRVFYRATTTSTSSRRDIGFRIVRALP